MCIGFIDYPIENNYFGRNLLDEKVFVVSFYQVAEILQSQNIDIFNFMLSTIYRYLTRNIVGKRIAHDETRGCVFDMCGNKNDIIYSCQKLMLCNECENIIKSSEVPENFIKLLKNEIKYIRKQRYYQIIDFIKRHPLFSIFIGAMSTIILSFFATVLYNLIF